jgi:flagellar FliL protein
MRPSAHSSGSTVAKIAAVPKAPPPDKDAKPADKPAAKPGGKKKWLVISIVSLLVLGGGGGGAWWWLGGAGAAKPAEAQAAAPRAPVFMNLEPFTVNLLEEDGEHYLQMSVVYQVADEKTTETMKAYLPVIRNRILLLLSSKRPSDLSTPAGKAKLVDELSAAVRESVPGTTPDRGVVQAFLGAFVVQ